MKKYAKKILALALSVMMVAEMWGGVNFVSQAATSEPESVTVGTKFPTNGSALTKAEYYITTAKELKAFVTASANNDYSGKTIHLAADINYAGAAWSYGDNAFLGTFDGHGYTISNVAMTGKGMFTTVGAGAAVKNFRLRGVTLTVAELANRVGIIAGTVAGGSIEDCTILDSTVQSTYESTSESACSVGGALGAIEATEAVTVSGLAVDNVDIMFASSVRDMGGLIGSADMDDKATITVNQCSVEDVKITTGQSCSGANVAGLIGKVSEGASITDCYVYGITTPKNTDSSYIAGAIGSIAADSGQATTVKNCYVTDAVLAGSDFVGEVIGNNAGTKVTLKNLAYYNCNITRKASRNNKVYTNNNIEEITYDQYANGTMAYFFNIADGGNAKIWTIKDNTPRFAEGTDAAPVKVVFRGESGTKVQYTNSMGVVSSIPEPDDGFVWVGVPDDGVFTENTWIYDRMIGAIGTPFSKYSSKPNETDYYISTANELAALANASSDNTFAGVTIHLANDIDMTGVQFGGIGSGSSMSFCGTFDGHGYTISNMKLNGNGMFNCIGDTDNQAIIKNFTLDKANVSGTSGNMAVVVSKYYGLLAAMNDNDVAYNNQVINVTVQNSTANFSGNDYGIIAGRFAVSSESGITLDRCKVINTDMINTTDSSTNDQYWGMLIGRDESTGLTRILGCEVIDSNMITTTCNLSNAAFGMGKCTGADRIEDSVIEGCTFTNGVDTTSASSNIGGFVGHLNSGSGRITDSRISDTTFTFEGGINYVGGLAGRANGGAYAGNKVSGVTINANKSNGTNQYGRMGGAYGASSARINISDTEVTDITINQEGRCNTTAGLIGEVGGGSSSAGVSSNIQGCALKNIIINENYSNNAAQSYSYGGVAGALGQYTSATFREILVDGLQITMNTHVMRCGGILGWDQGKLANSRYQECVVNNFTFKTTNNNDSATYEHKLGGIVGLIENTSPQFHTCSVNNFNVNTVGRATYIGGIVGKTENLAQPKLYRCAVDIMNIAPTENRNMNYIGGIAGNLVEGSTMTNCYVTDLKSVRNRNNAYTGGLVGNIANHTSVDSKMYIKNCYVQNFQLKTVNTTNCSALVGRCAATNMQSLNNWYYNSTYTTDSGQALGSDSKAIAGTEVTNKAILTNGTLAWSLNTENDNSLHSGSWAQGDSNPVLINGGDAAYVKVKFQGIDSSTTLITKADGTIDESQIPTPDAGYVWRVEPNRVFTTDTTIPLQPKTEEDLNEDGFYRVDDLIRGKKASTAASTMETVRNKILNPNPTDEVKVMCYNVYYEAQDTDGRVISNRIKKVKNLIKDYANQGYGVIGLQEVMSETWQSTILDLIDETNLVASGYGRYGGTLNNPDSARDTYSLILYDTTMYTKVKEGHFWFSNTPSVKSKWSDSSNYRVANWIILRDKATNKEFLFMNAHMEQTAPEGYTEAQSISVRRKTADLMAKVCRENAGNRPVIAVGDWNSYSGKDGYSEYTAYGYKDVRLNAEVNQDIADTGAAHGSYNAWDREDTAKWAWGDHITMSPWCHATFYDILATEDIDADTGYHISDHSPILAHINM